MGTTSSNIGENGQQQAPQVFLQIIFLLRLFMLPMNTLSIGQQHCGSTYCATAQASCRTQAWHDWHESRTFMRAVTVSGVTKDPYSEVWRAILPAGRSGVP